MMPIKFMNRLMSRVWLVKAQVMTACINGLRWRRDGKEVFVWLVLDLDFILIYSNSILK